MEYKRNKEDRVLEELKRAANVELARYFVAFYIKTILADLQYSLAIVVIFCSLALLSLTSMGTISSYF